MKNFIRDKTLLSIAGVLRVLIILPVPRILTGTPLNLLPALFTSYYGSGLPALIQEKRLEWPTQSVRV